MMQEKMWKLIIQNDFVLNNAFFYIKCTHENKDANVIINKLKELNNNAQDSLLLWLKTYLLNYQGTLKILNKK